uniref:Uncharacterized protein n=1 Tax=Avena sativa TaxID=4498 RepID=A0ACD5X1A9_AVESA
MRCLRVTSHGVWKKSADDINKFISNLLLLRYPGTTLDEVELHFTYEPSDNDVAYPNIWIRHALLCQARVLSVTLFAEFHLVFNVPPLFSRYLRKLELTFLDMNGNILDFSSCPSLEVLDIIECSISTGKISHSVKRLSIQYSTSCRDSRTRISVLSLTNLQLVPFHGEAPLLERNTSLKLHFSVLAQFMNAVMKVILGNVAVLVQNAVFIFRRDLKRCPTFVKLKKLFLDDWCVEADLRALVCMLEHSPILEISNCERDLDVLWKGRKIMV